jgi:hypothetical protein
MLVVLKRNAKENKVNLRSGQCSHLYSEGPGFESQLPGRL